MSRTFIAKIEDWNGADPLSVVGSTGSGKTKLVLDTLRNLKLNNPLIVSIDAVAVYQHLDVGSAKPNAKERADFDWVGLSFINPSEQINAARFLNQVSPFIAEALKVKRPVILVGGSHFYERALIEGTGPGEASSENFLKELDHLSSQQLHDRLLSVDSRWQSAVNINDRYRIKRYLDLAERQQISFDRIFTERNRDPLFENLWNKTATLVIGLDAKPSDLSVVLSQRIEQMIDGGWFSEVQSLLDSGYTAKSPGLQSVGYLEVVEHLLGVRALEETKKLILTRHLQLAKKQRTWLRKLSCGE